MVMTLGMSAPVIHWTSLFYRAITLNHPVIADVDKGPFSRVSAFDIVKGDVLIGPGGRAVNDQIVGFRPLAHGSSPED